MTVLVTGVAGFIGSAVAASLLDRGHPVFGVDTINDYYPVALKEARLARLTGRNGFRFAKVDIAEPEILAAVIADAGVDRIVHLAAQPGVRYSLTNPFAYARSNLLGHLSVLELFRHLPAKTHLVYASSSSVYGGNKTLPFSTADRVDDPVSLYAATKKADELMSRSYAHLYRLPMTGLRFFTVYGPWGRPDMAVYGFTRDIFAGKEIAVFNHGKLKRDFTYIDDIVSGVVAALDHPPKDGGEEAPPHRVYNIGNNNPEAVPYLIELIEQASGKKARIRYEPMQPGDVKETYADIEDIRRDLGFEPKTPLSVGIPKFVDWFRDFHKDDIA